MSLLSLIIILCLLGGLAWLVNTKVPGPSVFKTIANIVLVVTAIILTLVAFGIWDQIRGVQVPKL